MRTAIVALMLVTSVGVLAGTAASKPGAKGLGSIVVGTDADASGASITALVEKKFLSKEGISATLRVFPTGQIATESMATGQADLTVLADYPLCVAADQGADIQTIAQLASSRKQLGAAANGSVTTPKSLEGKKVGFPFGTPAQVLFRRYVQYYHLDASKITQVNTPVTQLPAALARGNVDAIFAWDPWITQGAASVSHGHILMRGGDHNIDVLHAFVVVSPKIYKNPKLATAVLRALVAAGRWSNTHRAQLAQLLESTLQEPSAQANLYANYFNYSIHFTPADLADLQQVNDYLFANKFVTTKKPLSAFANVSFLKKLYPSLTR